MTRPRTRRPLRRAVVVTATLLGLASACSGGDDTTSSASSAEPTPSAEPTAPPTAEPPPEPAARACYRLDFDAALAPTAEGDPVDCSRPHTSLTVAVGVLDNRAGGHLLAVDSRQVREAVARDCPEQFAAFVGGTPDDRRLSMLQPVWFTPTLEQSAAGAQWFRCDAIAVAGTDRLADLTGRLQGVMDSPEARERYAMCGTAAPDAADFERVTCGSRHTWRAVSVVDLGGGDYPGRAVARERGQVPCEDEGAQVAEDSLDYEWAYEWPTAEQWRQGQTFGRCWAPA